MVNEKALFTRPPYIQNQSYREYQTAVRFENKILRVGHKRGPNHSLCRTRKEKGTMINVRSECRYEHSICPSESEPSRVPHGEVLSRSGPQISAHQPCSVYFNSGTSHKSAIRPLNSAIASKSAKWQVAPNSRMLRCLANSIHNHARVQCCY